MKHDFVKKERVKALRVKGWSLGQIHEETKIPKTTIRSWISKIKLTNQQIDELRNRTQKALQTGRIRKQLEQKKLKTQKIEKLTSAALKEMGGLSKRDLFIAGISLYWAEGFKNKHEHRLGFCNSDPEMIKFYIYWLKKTLLVKEKDIIARLTLNVSYVQQTEKFEQYWASITKIPVSQFSKPFYQNTKWKKQYNTDNYHGVLRLHVKNSTDQLTKTKGWIKGLKSAKISEN